MSLEVKKPEILKLLDQGLSIEKLAKRLEVSYSSVYKFLKKENLQTKAKYSDTKALLPKVLELNALGKTNREISKITGINETTVGKLLKQKSKIDLHAETVKKLNCNISVISKIDSRTRLYGCNNGHKFVRKTNNFLQTPICPECAPRSANEDRAFGKLINFAQFSRNVKIPNSNLELDFFMEAAKLGIEYCGEYWHSEKYKDKYYHRTKFELASKANITLLQFWEYEFLEKEAIVLSIIKSKLGLFSRRLQARNLTINLVPKAAERAFLNNNHLQGQTPSIVCFGLYQATELISLLSLRISNGSLEIARYATLLDVQVLGGFSKLFKRVIEYAKTNNFNKVFTYANARYSNGNVYRKAGMQYVGMTSVDFFWLKSGKRYNRRASWATKEFDGALKVYGVGNLKFELEIK